MPAETNPYAPPKHDGEPNPVGANPELDAIRREHINAETNVKTVGALLYLATFGLITGGLKQLDADVGVAVISLALGAVFGLAGYWLRRLDPRGRLIYTIFVAIVVPLAVVGSKGPSMAYEAGRMSWFVLFAVLLWVPKARTAMTPHYRDVVIPATPHVKRKTSVVVIVIVVVLLLALLAMVASS